MVSQRDNPHIFQAVEASLTRLKTDYIDLYQYHFPDPDTPREETLRALEDLVHQGKVRYIGCSNIPAWQLVDATWISKVNCLPAFLSTQAEYNLLSRGVEDTLFQALKQVGMSFLPFFPLASGLLSGKYRKGMDIPEGTRFDLPYFKGGMTEDRLDKIKQLIAFAETRGHTVLELAFAWLLAQPLVASVIAGATKPEQVRANVAAPAWKLTTEDLAEINALKLTE